VVEFFNGNFIVNLLLSLPVKNFENRSMLAEAMDKSISVLFFLTPRLGVFALQW